MTADAAGRKSAANAFLAFYGAEAVVHFREEEEQVVPLLSGPGGELPGPAERVLHDHIRLHALARLLARDLSRGEVRPELLEETGELLRDHVRLEEREVFPLVERTASPDELADLRLGAGAGALESAVIDLDAPGGRGALWTAVGTELNATLVAWAAGEGVGEHVNLERDVLLVAVGGAGVLSLDGEDQPLRAPGLALIPRGRRRAVLAGSSGLRYVSVHLRRPAGIPLGRFP